MQVRERLQAILVLEVVLSAFYVSDDTEFEFIENKIMGFRMTGRQIWVEVALPQQLRKQKMNLKNVQGCLLLSYMEGILEEISRSVAFPRLQKQYFT